MRCHSAETGQAPPKMHKSGIYKTRRAAQKQIHKTPPHTLQSSHVGSHLAAHTALCPCRMPHGLSCAAAGAGSTVQRRGKHPNRPTPSHATAVGITHNASVAGPFNRDQWVIGRQRACLSYHPLVAINANAAFMILSHDQLVAFAPPTW